jgi:serine/threonine protein kinase/tetratricopeptide (TPR) repeat protein
MLDRIAHYRILRKLGEGGVGVVYAAHDERLERLVALKTLKESTLDDLARRRLWREARVAAGINHPSICQLYEIGEYAGELYLTMELLEGESLAARIGRSALAVPEAIQISLGILAALEVLHGKGVMHRDLKPSNIFLTPSGVKLLDFGLARPVHVSSSHADEPTVTAITKAGTVVGTPHYMAPEQLLAPEELDARTDLFAAGAILFEMLTGRRAFAGSSEIKILHAVLYEQPPALSGSTSISAVDLIVRRALAKNREDRYSTAHAMSNELRAALLRDDIGSPTMARAMTRLIVLPFRMLRPDPEFDYLSFSLPDAITHSLYGLGSLVVRSSLTAAKYGAVPLDLKVLGSEAEVDVALSGTLLRSGDQLRITTQLAEVPGGTVISSQTSQRSLRDIFQLQDDLVQCVVESLALPLTAREHRLLKHDVSTNAAAYEYYLRANQLSYDWQQIPIARDLYLRCVELDPNYAPGWARLGRCYRLLAKYWGDDEDFTRAESAFCRALDLNAELELTHNFFAQLESDLGGAERAMVRLLRRAEANANDPNLFAGLVYVCRFCGLLNASISAHEHARRLDPRIPTSVTHTFFMAGDYRKALDTSPGVFGYMGAVCLAYLGREQEALTLLRKGEHEFQQELIRNYLMSLRALLEGKQAESLKATDRAVRLIHKGGEELYYMVRQLAYLGETTRAIQELERSVEYGFFCYQAMVRDPWLNSLRSDQEFMRILQGARRRHDQARQMFLDHGGERLLGPT